MKTPPNGAFLINAITEARRESAAQLERCRGIKPSLCSGTDKITIIHTTISIKAWKIEQLVKSAMSELRLCHEH